MNIEIPENLKTKFDDCILVGYCGSISHNTVVEDGDYSTDDIDLMGVKVAPISCYLGIDNDEGSQTQTGQFDITIFEIRKFVRLLIKSNPNVIGFLWANESMYIKKDSLGETLINHRNIFSTKQMYYTFLGYAISQMKKMFGGSYMGYMGTKRKQLFDRFGYDPKNAAHMIRLLRMGNEFLRTGELVTYRPDREELIEIKCGKWSKDKAEREGQRLMEELKASILVSKLPETVDIKRANQLCMEIVGEYYDWQRPWYV